MEEIKVGDLMIGNYIHIKVTEISKKTVRYGFDYKARYEDLRPIPLTDDILLNFGFTCHSDNSYSIEINTPDTHLVLRQVRYEFYPFIEQMAEFSSQKDNVVYLKYIKSVHELQNLFKILSGKDLKNNKALGKE